MRTWNWHTGRRGRTGRTAALPGKPPPPRPLREGDRGRGKLPRRKNAVAPPALTPAPFPEGEGDSGLVFLSGWKSLGSMKDNRLFSNAASSVLQIVVSGL